MSDRDLKRNRRHWSEKAFEKFPFTVFSGIQSFVYFQNLTDFLGGIVEFPIALAQ